MLGSMSITHWIVVIAVLVLLFGRGRISGLMEDIGKGLRSLRHIGDESEDAERVAQDEIDQIRRVK